MVTSWPSSKVKQTFLDFFQQRGHTLVPSSSVVPHDDPTALFTGAGMFQFKPIFLQTVDSESPLRNLRRAASVQKLVLIRMLDIENVGRDPCWHTFFEMLGNWSFGDYSKTEALSMAWELLTDVYNIPADRLYVSYYPGDYAKRIEPDLECRDIWRNLGVNDCHIIPGDKVLNFWKMGAVGPCGPSSKIHFDFISNRDPTLVNASDPFLVEFWDIAFVSLFLQDDGSLRPVGYEYIDTGMGLERLVSIMQGKTNSYDTDLFSHLLHTVYELCKSNPSASLKPYDGHFGVQDVGNIDTAYRVIVDHVRAICVAIADGQLPNSSGRGHVLRKIFRRAVSMTRLLGQEIEDFWPRLVKVCIEQMGSTYPNMRGQLPTIIATLQKEEAAFCKIIHRCERVFDKLARTRPDGQVITGSQLWKMYETYGFPIDLMEQLGLERGLNLDWQEFDVAREKSKDNTAKKRCIPGGHEEEEGMVAD
ncbi:alanyl-tRNA synthetase [Atractiella rhizophila]|nr:alanyl-tRNA synthetase [Atractiella rhizophila]